MNDASICLFAWDLHDEGTDAVLGTIADLGLTSLFLASVYHAGWFVLPHNPRRVCYMPEDGVAYFHPSESLYRDTSIKPQMARLARQTDWFAEVGWRLNRYDLRLTAWTVCMHNTLLGLKHPEHTVRNALGDHYPNALCPANPAVRAYVRALARDLATQYPLQSIFFEAPNYRGRRHGHHHERTLVPIRALENVLMDISFSEHDVSAAQAEGIDVERLRLAVADHLRAYLAEAGRRVTGLPETLEQFSADHPELADYLAVLDRQVASLMDEIRADLVHDRVRLEGVENLNAYDVLLTGAYGLEPAQVARHTRQAAARKAAHQQLRVGFRLGATTDGVMVPASAEQLRDCVHAAVGEGAHSLLFYNYSESAIEHLRWIKPALAGMMH